MGSVSYFWLLLATFGYFWQIFGWNRLPATQPLDGSFKMEEGGHMEGVWGQLYPPSGTFPRLAQKQEMFRLGRAKTSDYVISG